MEAYTIWTTLNLKGNALAQMDAFSKATDNALKAVNSLKLGLATLNTELDDTAGILKEINPALAMMARTMFRLKIGANGTADGMWKLNSSVTSTSARLKTASENAGSLAASLNAVAMQSAGAAYGLGQVRGVRGAGGGFRGGSGGGGGGGAYDSVYGAGPVIGSAAVGGAAIGAGAKKFGHGLAHGFGFLPNPYIAAGVAAAMLGVGGFKQYSSFATTGAQVAGQGFSAADVNRATSFANNSNLPGISHSDMLTAVVDAAMATGNMSMSLAMAPQLAKLSVANKGIFKGAQGFSKLEENKLIRFAEQRGGSDPKKIQQAIDVAEQVYTSSGGRILPSQLFNLQTMAGTALYNESSQGYIDLISVLSEQPGFRVGTGLQTGFNRLLTGKGLKGTGRGAAAEGLRIGLLKPGVNGGPALLKDQYVDEFSTNNTRFVLDVIKPLMIKAGKTTLIQQTTEVAKLFDTTYARFVNNTLKSSEKINRVEPLHEKAYTSENAYVNFLQLPAGKVSALSASFTNLEQALGKLTAPAVLFGINILTGLFDILSVDINKFTSSPIASLVKYLRMSFDPTYFVHSAVPPSSGSQTPVVVHSHVYMDSYKFGSAMSNSIGRTNNFTNPQGFTGSNTGTVPTNIALNYHGGGLSQ